MGESTGIGWTDHTLNFWWGCHKVSRECKYCYISSMMKRAGLDPFGGPIRTKNWHQAYRWNRQNERVGRRTRVFTCSMSDFFHPGADEWRADAWNVVANCQHLDWLILTKRPDRISQCLPADWSTGYPNVWLGVTAGKKTSLKRIDSLVNIPAAVKFVSAEPLLESLDLRPYLSSIDWVITGCEQARKGARKVMDIEWVREIDSQCRAAGVAHFFKQYYVEDSGTPCTDGMLDGVCRQEWPVTSCNLSSNSASQGGPG